LLPIFAFQKVEGKMFSPLAWTLGFALTGATIFTLTLVPVLISILLNKNVTEKSNFFVRAIHNGCMLIFNFTFHHKIKTMIFAAVVLIGGFYTLTIHGTEFLPQLNEGSYTCVHLCQGVLILKHLLVMLMNSERFSKSIQK